MGSTFFHSLQDFFQDLRQEGIPVTPSQVQDCCQALLLVNWENEEIFYTSLFTTLVKDFSCQEAFDKVYQKYFKAFALNSKAGNQTPLYQSWLDNQEDLTELLSGAMPLPPGAPQLRTGSSPFPRSSKNPLEKDFSLLDLDEVRKIEALFPLISRRLAARMIKKKKKNDPSQIDFRRTIRRSMATGGVPADIFTNHKSKEKPVILAICDVSQSVMEFSCFALALLASAEAFFRDISIFAFIDEIDEVNQLLAKSDPLTLRSQVLRKAKVVGEEGYTNYGFAFKAFVERFSGKLTHKTSVLIFGDARNNNYRDEAWALESISNQAKRVYWFNPEPRELWGSGDSCMKRYRKYCDDAFACPNILELEKAIGQL